MFRVSLREMFVLVAAVAVAIVSMIYAASLWKAIIGLAVVLSALIALIVGLVDSGPRRAFAIGFAIATLGYLLVVINAPTFTRGPDSQLGSVGIGNQNAELDAYSGRLPTSMLLGYLYAGIRRTYYFDAKTGQRIPEAESESLTVIYDDAFGPEGENTFGGGGMFGGAPIQASPGKRAAFSQTRPLGENFMATGHFWWALLFGYAGGQFGRFVYSRRNRERS
jgi:hypothetical protein